MNKFLEKFDKTLGFLREVFIANGITDDNFYTLDIQQLQVLFADHGNHLLTFIAQYNLEKTNSNSSSSQDTMYMELGAINIINQSQLHYDSHHIVDNLPPSNVSSSRGTAYANRIDEENITNFKENELYFLLMSRLDGRVLFNRYKYTKELQMSKLKDIVGYHLLEQDPVNYEVESEIFAKYRIYFIELFPTEKPDTFFSPYTYENGIVVGAHGALYNHYKIIRGLMKDGRMLNQSATTEGSVQSQRPTVSKSQHTCLTDPDRSKYSTSDILESWKQDYEQRKIQLEQTEKGKITVRIDSFLNSFTCLRSPLAFSLLEQDFERIVSELKSSGKLQTNLDLSQYLTLFREQWSETAAKIIKYARKPTLRNPELKIFLEKNIELIKQGSRNDIIAFSLLPIFIQVSTKINTGRKIEKTHVSNIHRQDEESDQSSAPVQKKLMVLESINITKEEAFDSFISYIESVADLQAKKRERMESLEKLNQPMSPYLIFVGDFNNTSAYIIFKNEDLYYEDPITAIQECFKIHLALRRFPTLSKSFWHFIGAEVYGFTHWNCTAFVLNYITKINK